MDERNYYLEKELLYKALAENLEKRFEETVGENVYDGEYPKRFRRKMSKIIGADIENPEKEVNSLKKYIVVGLIVAAIALAGCAIIGKVLGPYVEEWYNEYILVKNEDEESGSKFIEEIYTLTYVPEGYEYVKEHSSPNLHVYIWNNSNNEVLKFIQNTAISDFYIDIESGYSYLTENNGVKIYCKTTDNYHSYICHNNKYKFEIISQEQISEPEIKKMLDGIVVKE